MGMTKTEPEQRSDAGAAPEAGLLAALKPNTDLAWLVGRVVRNKPPIAVVPDAALTAWEERDPAGWATVSAWLSANGVTIVRT